MIDREKAKETFLAYASRYDISDPKIKLKVDHTLRVCDLCVRIAQSLRTEAGDAMHSCSVSEEDVDLAFLIGLLHDIGRFEQVRIYHTFIDANSVNHAQLSADLMFREGMIRQYIDDTKHDSLIETAIRCHNVYRLPDTLSDRDRMFCQILRDADKIDIIRANRETPMTQIYNMPEEEFVTSRISDPVFHDVMAHTDVNRKNVKTGIDHLIGHIAFVFGIVYPISLRIVREQGYLDQMLSFESRNEQTSQRMAAIREEVGRYLE